jgi:hypothetical protein
MPSSSRSYGDRKQEDADVRYNIATPFHPRGNDAEILLFDEGETIEVIVHRIPDPTRYCMNHPDPDSEELNPEPTENRICENAVAH